MREHRDTGPEPAMAAAGARDGAEDGRPLAGGHALAWARAHAQTRGGRVSEILPGLLLGNKMIAADRPGLDACGVAAIVNVGGGANRFDGDGAIAYHRIVVEDHVDASLLPHWPAACEFVRGHMAAGRTVLVHCKGGMSRSPATVLAFLVRVCGLSLMEAWAVVVAGRPTIRINTTFRRELVAWAGDRVEPSERPPKWVASVWGRFVAGVPGV